MARERVVDEETRGGAKKNRKKGNGKTEVAQGERKRVGGADGGGPTSNRLRCPGAFQKRTRKKEKEPLPGLPGVCVPVPGFSTEFPRRNAVPATLFFFGFASFLFSRRFIFCCCYGRKRRRRRPEKKWEDPGRFRFAFVFKSKFPS